MPYEAKNYDSLLGLEGFSDTLLKNHFTLYQGYVTNFNKLDETMKRMETEGKFGTMEFAELNRRLAWEWNGMRLHELYFGNMTKNPTMFDPHSALGEAIRLEFGGQELFVKDFRSMGAMRGIGWVVLAYDKEAKRLFNIWINEHDTGHLAGAEIILVMDVFEHAFMIDYGLKRTDYIEAFWKSIDWTTVNKRFESK